MKIFKTTMFIGGDNTGTIYVMDTIKHEGKMWLVPTWLEAPDEGWKIPERIVCLDNLPHQVGGPGQPFDFLLNNPVPKDVLYSEQIPTELANEYVVIMHPDIKVSIPKGIH